MADKRKSCYTILLKNQSKGKTNKVELYHAREWGSWEQKFRVRVNGKWFNGKHGEKQFYYKSEILDMISKSIKI